MNISRFTSTLVLLCLFFFAQRVDAQCDIIITVETTNISCSGLSNGYFDIIISGASGPNTYIWSNGNTDEDISGLSVGVYTVTVTDDLGCTASATGTISGPANGLTLVLNDDGIINCQNVPSEIVPDVDGGVLPYDFLWSNGVTTNVYPAFAAGTYTLTVTDANGCTISAQKTINVSPTYPIADAGPDDIFATCATAPNIIGGSGTSVGPNFVYQWVALVGNIDPWVDPTQRFIEVTESGAYTLIVTSLVENCSTDDIVTVQVDGSFPVFSCVPPPVFCLVPQITLDATASSTGPQYTYQWTTSNGHIVSGAKTLTPVVNAAGTYLLTITNIQEGCSKIGQVVVSNQPIVANAGPDTGIPCGGTQVTLNGTNSSIGAQYTHFWTTANGNILANANTLNPIVNQPGTYTLVVTNILTGCTKTDDVKVFPGPAIPSTDFSLLDVSCTGQLGIAGVNMTQGTGPNTYLWSNGSTEAAIVNIFQGAYSVTVTDATGCDYYGEVEIKDTSTLTLSAQTTAPSCNPGNDGAIDLTATTVFGPIEYTWNTGETTQDLSNLQGGTYIVTVTYAGATCTQTLSVPLPTAGMTLSTLVSNGNSCITPNGHIDLTVTNGTGPFIYTWSDGETAEDASPISLGTFTVTVTDALGCTQTTSATIDPTAGITLPTVVTNASCLTACTGSVNLTVLGGVPSNYAWSPGQTNQDVVNLCAGVYTVTVYMTNGCSKTTSVTINLAPSVALSTTHTDADCTGACTGVIDLTVTGGVLPYKYIWSTGPTTQDISNLCPSTYTVTVTDANGLGCTSTALVVIGIQSSGMVVTAVPTNSTCNGTDGSIALTVNGGTAPYTYSWTTGATIQNLINLASGIYTVTVSDATNCTQTASTSVGQNSGLSLSAVVLPSTSCNVPNGAIDLTVSPLGSYLYFWSNGNTTEDLVGLSPGTYTVTVSDGSGCTAVDIFIVPDNPDLPLPTALIIPTICDLSNGSIDISVTNGVSPYNFLWSNGETTEDIFNVISGNYDLTVTGANGCTQAFSVNVSNNNPAFNLTVTIAPNTDCVGNPNGSIDLSVTPAGPYTYIWSNGPATQDLNNLLQGTYSVTISAGGSCTQEASYVVPANPNGPSLSTNITDASCNGNDGGVDLTVTGGTPAYTYIWSNSHTVQDCFGLPAGTYTVTVTDALGCTQTTSALVGQTANLTLSSAVTQVTCFGGNDGGIDLTVTGGVTPYIYDWAHIPGVNNPQDPSNLPAGTYTCTITDFNGCTKTTSVSITQPTATTITETHTNVLCNGGNNGSIDLTVTGGAPGYTYNWSNSVTVQDLSGLVAGMYTVTVTDGGGCTQTSSATIAQPTAITITETHSNVLCNGGNDGSIDLTVTGGAPGYTYNWSNSVTVQDISGLVAGIYTVTVTDGGGCTQTSSATIAQPTTIAITETHTNVLCSGGNNASIDLTVSGGAPGYTYNWSNGAIVQDIAGLTAGTYTVTVTDANGCTKTRSSTITQFSPLSLAAQVNAVSCFGGNNGAINLSVTGGATPYVYSWSNTATTQDLSNLISGVYTVTVTDANSCTAFATYVVTQPVQIVFSIVSLSNTCSSETISGPNLPNLSYLWSGPNNFISTTPAITVSVSGLYSLTITDANGCTATNDYSVNLSGGGACGAIKGRVFHDEDESCSLNFGEPGLAGWIVRAEGLNDTLYGVTNAQGRYVVGVPLGTYAMKVLVPNGLWSVCPGGAPVTVGMAGDTILGGDFPVQAIYICPALTVSIGTGQLKRCFSDNYYQVEYCNQGTQKAEDAYITVVLDPFLTVLSASVPYTDLGVNAIHVEVGDLEVGECGTFKLQVYVGCNAALGQTHCTNAAIYPDTLCAPSNANWSGASLSIQSVCSSDSLRFTIQNSGKGNMSNTSNYIVVEDGIMFRQGVLSPLGESETMVIAVPANGSTWRVEVDQEAYHPYSAPVGLSVEGCTTASSFSTGFLNQFSTPDEPPTVDIDCTTNVGSFDPNDKQGYPVGYGADHYIRPGTDIEYLVRFQNTGTDTAFTVQIIDTLSAWLDPASIRFGCSSHPYRYDLNGEGIVHFIFEDIFLPDSNTNEAASHGFAKFIIKPRFEAPLETLIENTAAIFFDFNDPVYTNTTFHRLGENFLTVGLWQPATPRAEISAVPNPFHEETTLTVKGLLRNDALKLQVFDLRGNVLREMETESGEFHLKKGEWQSGIYLFKITQNGQLVGSGKLVSE